MTSPRSAARWNTRWNMGRISVAVDIDAPPDVVWDVIEPLEDHPDWMHDAVSVRFATDQTRGVGTRTVVDTKVGPLRLTDHMTVTEWEPGASMGVEHTGVVTGSGRFTLQRNGQGGTTFSWDEELRFRGGSAARSVRWWAAGSSPGSGVATCAASRRWWRTAPSGRVTVSWRQTRGAPPLRGPRTPATRSPRSGRRQEAGSGAPTDERDAPGRDGRVELLATTSGSLASKASTGRTARPHAHPHHRLHGTVVVRAEHVGGLDTGGPQTPVDGRLAARDGLADERRRSGRRW